MTSSDRRDYRHPDYLRCHGQRREDARQVSEEAMAQAEETLEDLLNQLEEKKDD